MIGRQVYNNHINNNNNNYEAHVGKGLTFPMLPDNGLQIGNSITKRMQNTTKPTETM